VQGSQGPQGPAGTGTTFFRGAGSVNTVSAGSAQAVELHCPAGYTAIGGGFTSDDPLVNLSADSFDPNDATGIIIGVTNFDTGAADWTAEGTCEQ
jgi:hypothetical protein